MGLSEGLLVCLLLAGIAAAPIVAIAIASCLTALGFLLAIIAEEVVKEIGWQCYRFRCWLRKRKKTRKAQLMLYAMLEKGCLPWAN